MKLSAKAAILWMLSRAQNARIHSYCTEKGFQGKYEDQGRERASLVSTIPDCKEIKPYYINFDCSRGTRIKGETPAQHRGPQTDVLHSGLHKQLVDPIKSLLRIRRQ